MYEYKMAQVPPNIQLSLKAEQGTEAAAYLQGIVNDAARDGWEFQRVDSIGVHVAPGCLGALTGMAVPPKLYYVGTFRRVAGTHAPA